MLSYCLVSSLFTPRVRILRKGRTYVLGRDRRVDFPLPSEIVSRQHAEIAWREPVGFEIRDLESKNGTKINGEPVDEHVLVDGDSIWLGPFTLTYREYHGDIAGLLAEADSGDATVSMSKHLLQPGGRGFVLGGRFSAGELLEICQLIGLNEKDGNLTVEPDGGTGGFLAFRHGHVVRARLGEQRGEAAALALLALRAGSFEFTGGDPGPEECSIPSDMLIMEAARRADEGAETRTFEPPPLARDDGVDAADDASAALDPDPSDLDA